MDISHGGILHIQLSMHYNISTSYKFRMVTAYRDPRYLLEENLFLREEQIISSILHCMLEDEEIHVLLDTLWHNDIQDS